MMRVIAYGLLIPGILFVRSDDLLITFLGGALLSLAVLVGEKAGSK